MPDELKLSPFPNDVLEGPKEGAIRFLLGLNLPGRFADQHLQRWGLWRDVEITREDYARVRGAAVPRFEG